MPVADAAFLLKNLHQNEYHSNGYYLFFAWNSKCLYNS